MPDTLRGGYDISGPPRQALQALRENFRQAGRARNAAVFTRFWQEVEQYRRVPLREGHRRPRLPRGPSWQEPARVSSAGRRRC
jgi:hypothetical protein